jgi:hypothetical protein
MEHFWHFALKNDRFLIIFETISLKSHGGLLALYKNEEFSHKFL